MKKHLSVFMLASRFMLWPTVIVSLLGAAATFTVLMYDFQNLAGAYNAPVSDGDFFDAAAWPVRIGMLALFILLTRPLRERGGVQPDYTLRRLRVGELAVFFWQGLAAAMSLFVFLAFQAAVCFGLGLYLQNAGYGSSGNMSLIVALVNSPVAHMLLPLGDWLVYIRLALMLMTLGLSTSYSAFISRMGKTALSPFALIALSLLLLFSDARTQGVELSIILLCPVVILCMYASVSNHIKYDGEPEEAAPVGGEDLG